MTQGTSRKNLGKELVIPAKAGIQFFFSFKSALADARVRGHDEGRSGGDKKQSHEEGESMNKEPCVYIMASGRNGTLYVGVTSDLIKRLWEHQNDVVDGFSKKCKAHTLVWYEQHLTMESAITREKQLKKWNRMWKLREIELMNPSWRDLSEEVIGC